LGVSQQGEVKNTGEKIALKSPQCPQLPIPKKALTHSCHFFFSRGARCAFGESPSKKKQTHSTYPRNLTRPPVRREKDASAGYASSRLGTWGAWSSALCEVPPEPPAKNQKPQANKNPRQKTTDNRPTSPLFCVWRVGPYAGQRLACCVACCVYRIYRGHRPPSTKHQTRSRTEPVAEFPSPCTQLTGLDRNQRPSARFEQPNQSAKPKPQNRFRSRETRTTPEH
jgi:hypothetical protein